MLFLGTDTMQEQCQCISPYLTRLRYTLPRPSLLEMALRYTKAVHVGQTALKDCVTETVNGHVQSPSQHHPTELCYKSYRGSDV